MDLLPRAFRRLARITSNFRRHGPTIAFPSPLISYFYVGCMGGVRRFDILTNLQLRQETFAGSTGFETILAFGDLDKAVDE